VPDCSVDCALVWPDCVPDWLDCDVGGCDDVDSLGDCVVDDCPVDWLLAMLLVIKKYLPLRSEMQPVMVVLLAFAFALPARLVSLLWELLSGVWAGRLVVSGACAKDGAEQSSSDALNSETVLILSLLVNRSIKV
jgi:hypothetical protein